MEMACNFNLKLLFLKPIGLNSNINVYNDILFIELREIR